MTSPAEPAPEREPSPFAPPSGAGTPPPAPRDPGAPDPASGWGQPSDAVGYDRPRYGAYAPGGPPPAGVSPYGEPGFGPPPSGTPHGGPPPAGQSQYGQAQYGAPQGFGGKGLRPLAARPGIIPLRPLSLGEIYDGAFGAIRANPKVMLGVVALVIAVATIIPTIIGYLLAPTLNRGMDSFAAEIDPEGILEVQALAGELTISLLVTLGVSLATVITTGLLIVAISRSVIDRPYTTAELWAEVRGKVVGLVVVSLVPSLIIIVGGGILLVVGVVIAEAISAGLAAVYFLVVMVAVLVGAVWLVVRFMLVPAVYVLEGQGLGASIRRGWTLSRGTFWRLLGIYLLSSLITGTVANLIVFPGILVAGLIYPAGYATEIGGLAIITVVQVAAFTITTAFLSAVIALLYIDVRMQREGLDVELAAAADEV